MANEQKPNGFLLRIEATNLSNFIADTDDLSTIRGAGLLLLNASKFLCGDPDRKQDADSGESSLFSREEDDSYHKDGIKLELVSSGASIAIFQFEATDHQAEQLCCEVDQWLRHHDRLRHATFVVTVVKAASNGSFSQSLEESVMKTRLIQMRIPNVSIGRIQTATKQYSPSSFCDIDHKRARAVDLKEKDNQGHPKPWYAKAADKNHASDATSKRRAYGRDMKVRLHQMVAESGAEFEDFSPSWEFEEIARRGSWCVEGDSASDSPHNAARDKMAVIYIDGNKFGSLFQGQADDSAAYGNSDCEMRDRRRNLMRSLIRHIRDKPRWQVAVTDPLPFEPKVKNRIETLLWGGDELVWVVPAWCGLEAVQFFFETTATADWKVTQGQLTHAVGVVFCSYKSPIRSVVSLAKDLAESVKDRLEDLSDGDSETAVQHLPTSNAMAYEVLESFDHLGRNFGEARADRRMPQMDECDAILTAVGTREFCEHLQRLKESRLPKRRVHQIAQVFRRTAYAIEGATDDPESLKALDGTAYGKLIDRTARTTDGDGEKLKRRLNDPLHWRCLSKLPAKWFHLLELWDYAGYPEPST